MKKIIVPFLLGVLVSLYFFPVSFNVLPSFNTKQMLAVFGAAVFFIDCFKNRKLVFSKEVFFSACIALLFSASCYYSVLYNATDDMSYATYIVSFIVWIAGAYGLCFILRTRYVNLDVHTVIKYLMWVCVAQCIAALLNDNVPAFKSAVNSVIFGNQFLDAKGRMYGIGAGLDPAGVRFSCVLVLIAYSLCEKVFKKGKASTAWSYIFSFFFIILIGNMISRTTTVGALLGLGYLAYRLGKIEYGAVIKKSSLRAILIIMCFLLIAVPIVVYVYNTSASMHDDLRYAFEGFFNWVETGEWRTDSTDKLNSVMWVWPTETKDWIIGTGRFENFAFSTDIGYCRYVWYCGLVGFIIFSLFFIYNAAAIRRKFKDMGFLSLVMIALTFVIWIKVATDIFQIYALLFCIDAVEEEDNEPIVEEIPEEDDLDSKLARWAEDYARK